MGILMSDESSTCTQASITLPQTLGFPVCPQMCDVTSDPPTHPANIRLLPCVLLCHMRCDISLTKKSYPHIQQTWGFSHGCLLVCDAILVKDSPTDCEYGTYLPCVSSGL